MEIFKLLEISDTYMISDYIKNSEIFIDKKNNFIGAHYNILEFQEVTVRQNMFNYEILCFADIPKGNINALLYYIFPKSISNVTSVELKMISNINTKVIPELVNYSVNKIKELFDDKYKRINIYIKEYDLSKEMESLMKNLKFQKEITLKDELGVNEDVIMFVKFME